jgi:hypothetical protein
VRGVPVAGAVEPEDTGDAAPCPKCGLYLYPLTWAQTWGLALLLVDLGLGGASAAVRLVR